MKFTIKKNENRDRTAKIERPPFEFTSKNIVNNGGDVVTVLPTNELLPFLLKIYELVDKVNELEEKVKGR